MYNDFPILGKPTATLDQINIWAKGKPVLFRQAIPLAYRLSLQYGIDPVVTIAQIAIETGYCRYGGKVTPAHKNTCGLKARDGKGFHKFATWAEGIEAHVQHLALYANSPKLRGKEIVDPRHFDSLRGTAKTVNQLSMKWATNSEYGNKINSLCRQIIRG